MTAIRYLATHNPAAATPTNDAENRRLCWAARHAETEEERLAARNELILRSQGLVGMVAAQFLGRTRLSLDDLRGEGQLGLIRAIARFDFDRGFAFTTYAAWSIYRALQDAVREQDHLIRIPKNFRSPKYISPHRAESERARHVSPLDDLTAANLTDREAQRTDSATEVLAGRLLRSLPAKHREVITLCFGLDPREAECLNTREAGERLGLTHQRISQLRTEAIARMAEACRKEMIA